VPAATENFSVIPNTSRLTAVLRFSSQSSCRNSHVKERKTQPIIPDMIVYINIPTFVLVLDVETLSMPWPLTQFLKIALEQVLPSMNTVDLENLAEG